MFMELVAIIAIFFGASVFFGWVKQIGPRQMDNWGHPDKLAAGIAGAALATIINKKRGASTTQAVKGAVDSQGKVSKDDPISQVKFD